MGVAIILVLVFGLSSMHRSSKPPTQNYSTFSHALNDNQVTEATVNQDSGHLTYKNASGQEYSVQGPRVNDALVELYSAHIPDLKLFTTTSRAFWLPFPILGAAVIVLVILVVRRAQGR